MLGAAGCIVPEILASAGVIPQTPAEVTWFRSGVIPPAGVYSKCALAFPVLFDVAEIDHIRHICGVSMQSPLITVPPVCCKQAHLAITQGFVLVIDAMGCLA